MKTNKLLLLFVSFILIGALSFFKPVSVSACTWVTTSCGSGCADNQNLYNCSSNVTVTSVVASNSNPDSNNKAMTVAPPAVTQVIAPAPKPATTTTTTQPAAPTGPSAISAAEKTAAGSCGTASFCGGVQSAYRCVPIMTTSGCNVRCGMTVDPVCGPKAGLTDQVGQRVASHAYSLPADTRACVNGETSCNTQTEMTIPCKTATGGWTGLVQCVPFDTIRQAELSGYAQSTTSNDDIAMTQIITNLMLGDQKAFVQVECTECDQYYLEGTAGGTFNDGSLKAGRAISGTAGTACTPGSFQTVLINGTPMTTQLGGDRGACGAEGGCPAGQQRACTSAGKLSSGCVRSDACAWQVQSRPLATGDSCVGLTRLSFGEATKGQFVGCSGNQNCFCTDFTASSTVRCYPDPELDSCGAAGGTTVAVSQVSNVPSGSNTLTSTTATPSTTTGPQCTNIAPSKGAPQIGDQISFTCTGTPSNLVVRYEFRYGVTTGTTITAANLQALAAAQGTPNISVPITVDRVGTYFAQCRPCTANTCLDWEPAQLK